MMCCGEPWKGNSQNKNKNKKAGIRYKLTFKMPWYGKGFGSWVSVPRPCNPDDMESSSAEKTNICQIFHVRSLAGDPWKGSLRKKNYYQSHNVFVCCQFHVTSVNAVCENSVVVYFSCFTHLFSLTLKMRPFMTQHKAEDAAVQKIAHLPTPKTGCLFVFHLSAALSKSVCLM